MARRFKSAVVPSTPQGETPDLPPFSANYRKNVTPPETAGAIVIASAGNDDTDSPRYPAAITSVIAVTGVDDSDVRADFANANDGWAACYGSHVDVSAPAMEIETTSWTDDFVAADGTSYAAAIVSAIVAAQKELSKSNSEAEADLEATAVDIDSLNPGFEGELGSGKRERQGPPRGRGRGRARSSGPWEGRRGRLRRCGSRAP